jgi:histidinol-phosphate aminotransferase
MNIQSLARPNILNMQAYSSGKSEYAGDAQIFLDTNENPYGDSVINRYPDPLQQKLVQRIVEIKSGQFDTTLTPENFALGNGSDEFIDQFVRIFCEPRQDALVYCPPTFGMYQVAAGLNDVTVFPVPLDEDFDLDVEGVLALNGTAKLLFLCSPNNPTGNRMSP